MNNHFLFSLPIRVRRSISNMSNIFIKYKYNSKYLFFTSFATAQKKLKLFFFFLLKAVTFDDIKEFCNSMREMGTSSKSPLELTPYKPYPIKRVMW